MCNFFFIFPFFFFFGRNPHSPSVAGCVYMRTSFYRFCSYCIFFSFGYLIIISFTHFHVFFIFLFVLCFTIALHFFSSCYCSFLYACIFIIKSESTKIVGLKLTLDKSKVGKEKGLFFPFPQREISFVSPYQPSCVCN